jgi:hypothetical protein
LGDIRGREWEFKGYETYNPLFGWGARELRWDEERELRRSILTYLFPASPLLIHVGSYFLSNSLY